MSEIEKKSVLILGSGPAAVSAAFALLEADFKVRLITADEATPIHGCDAFQAEKPDVSNLSPKVQGLIGSSGLQAYHQANGLECENFAAQGSLLSGGLSRVWGVVSPIWDQRDFDGFPFGFEQMAPHYERVGRRVPWSGDLPQRQKRLGNFPIHSPVPVVKPLQRLLKKSADVIFGHSPNMVARSDTGRFSSCTLCNDCFQGCEVNSLYRSDRELATLSQFATFELRHSYIVREVALKPDRGYLVKTINDKGEQVNFEDEIVFVALGAAASTALVGAMLPDAVRPEELLTTPAVAFSFIDPLSLFTRPKGEFALGQLSFEFELDNNHQTYGTIYRAQGLSDEQLLSSTRIPDFIGRLLVKLLKPALYIGLGFIPGDFSQNRLQFSQCGSRKIMKICGGNRPGTKRVLKRLVTRLARVLSRSGLFYIPTTKQILPSGGDSHYGGSLPMGSVLSDNGEVPGYPGLFVIDGAALSRLPAKHLAFTIMANADRIACHLIKRRGL